MRLLKKVFKAATKQAAKVQAAKELGLPTSQVTFIEGTDEVSGKKWVKASHPTNGFSDKYYY